MTKAESIRAEAVAIDNIVGLLTSGKKVTDREIELARRLHVPKLRKAADRLYDAAKKIEEGADGQTPR